MIIDCLVPRLAFLKIDSVARRQFYQLCSPILQHTLSKASKRISYESPKIDRHVSFLTLFDNDNYNIIRPLDPVIEAEGENLNKTYVVDIIDTLNLQSLHNGSLLPYIKCFMCFNHRTLSIHRSQLLEKEFQVIFHQNVEHLGIDQNSIPSGVTLLSLLKKMPNLKQITYNCEQLPPEWDSLMEGQHVGKIESFSVKITYTPATPPRLSINPKAVYDFFRRQHENFTFSISFIRWPVGLARLAHVELFEFFENSENFAQGELTAYHDNYPFGLSEDNILKLSNSQYSIFSQ